MKTVLFPSAIAALVARALREELALYPKPGLVSPVDCGSHPDMDVACFDASIAALEPFFEEMAAAGAEDESFAELQRIGLAAERAMLVATNGRNTHRGAIFCLGLLAAAAGARYADEPLGDIVRERWGADIPLPGGLPPDSHGLAMCRQFRIGGVRGEARAGFPSVHRVGLPALRHGLAIADFETAAIHAFFALLACCEDTTLLKRGGKAGLRFAREGAADFLAAGGVSASDWKSRAIALHHAFVARNLTAGGVADLLAATLFVHYLDLP
jgi:triphosphoribosyl-dephospho-CoA synthase